MAGLQLIIAQTGFVQFKRKPRFKDFLPQYIRDEDDGSEDLMAEVAAALAKQKQNG